MIIFRSPSSNSLDIFKYIKTNIDRNIARVYSKSDYKRKIIVSKENIDIFLVQIREYVNSTFIPRNSLVNAINNAENTITRFVQSKIEETKQYINEHVQQTVTQQVRQATEQVRETIQEEVREEIQETQEQVREVVTTVREEVQQAVTQVQETVQGVVQEINRTVEEVARVGNRLFELINQNRYRKIWYNNYYRDIHLRDGKVYVYPYKHSETLEEVPDDEYKFRR